jgi:hypothetical protein
VKDDDRRPSSVGHVLRNGPAITSRGTWRHEPKSLGKCTPLQRIARRTYGVLAHSCTAQERRARRRRPDAVALAPRGPTTTSASFRGLAPPSRVAWILKQERWPTGTGGPWAASRTSVHGQWKTMAARRGRQTRNARHVGTRPSRNSGWPGPNWPTGTAFSRSPTAYR